MRLQTLQPKFHLRIAAVFILAIIILGFFSFTKHGVYRAYYGGLSGLTALALIVQYSRERAIVHNRLSAAGVVTDYRIPLRSGPRIVRFLVSKFSPEVPRIKYSFVAFDQKTYTGETGWGARGLYKGAQLIILYNPGNPAANHPLGSFIFYSFR
ncbi:MAG TPA: hypothetical protein VI431_08385 [Candidatus Acidoferrum sp.]